MMKRAVPVPLAVVLGFLFPAIASATPFGVGASYSYSIGADLHGISVAPQTDADGAVSIVYPQFLGAFGSVATLDITGSATPGLLKGFVETTADVTGWTDTRSSASATGFVELGFFDTIKVTSNALALGTPAKFEYKASLHSSLAVIGNPNCSPGSPVPHGGFIDLLIMSGTLSVGKTVCGAAMPVTQPLTTIIDTVVGGEFVIDGRIRLFVGAGAEPTGNLYSAVTANAANTANFTLVSLTPGVGSESASGASYTGVTTVPEGGSLLLVGLGALSVFAAARLRLA